MLSSSQTIEVYPPKGFRPCGRITRAAFTCQPSFVREGYHPRGAKGKGLRYQSQIVKMLNETFLEGIEGPWFLFNNTYNEERFTQPDWLTFDFRTGIIYLVEIKLSRVEQAWWQLNKLYQPVLKAIFPQWDIAMVEIASNMYHIQVPGDVKYITRIQDAVPGKTSFMQVGYNAKPS